MKHYIITITLSNGDQVASTVESESSHEALGKLFATPKFQTFASGLDITRVECRHAASPSEANPTYIVQPSVREGHAVVTDTDHGITVSFQIGRLNATQKVTPLNESYSAAQLARFCRQMADWLQANRLDLVTDNADALRSWRLLRVGSRIAAERKRQGLTQAELAAMSDTPSGTVAKIERGEINASTAILGKIAAALGIELGIK